MKLNFHRYCFKFYCFFNYNMNFVIYSKQIETNIDYGNAIMLNIFPNKMFFFLLLVNLISSLMDVELYKI